jgi:hypothetical protein
MTGLLGLSHDRRRAINAPRLPGGARPFPQKTRGRVMTLRSFATHCAATLLLAATALPAFAESLKIINNSDYDIHELYVSAANAKNWGPDQLGADVMIEAGETYTVNNIPLGRYDLKLVDEDGTECSVDDVDFTTGKEWTVTNKLLERCDKFGH